MGLGQRGGGLQPGGQLIQVRVAGRGGHRQCHAGRRLGHAGRGGALHLPTAHLNNQRVLANTLVVFHSLWGGSKGVIHFPWIFIFMQCGSLVPVGHFRNISGHYALGLFAGLFSDAMGYYFPMNSCGMTRTKRLVLKDHIGSTKDDGIPGLQSFNCLNFHSIHTSLTVN